MPNVAVVTGALKGLGLETAKGLLAQGFDVVIAGRDPARGLKVEQELTSYGKVSFIELDVANVLSIDSFAATVLKNFGTVDVLVNNAGIYPDSEEKKKMSDLLQQGLTTNAIGPYLLSEKFLPLMLKKRHGRIVNVSSGMGQLSDMGTGSPAYRLSKVALNGVTKILAATTKGTDVLINSVCPGWVKTDMGGPNATRTLEQGAAGILWAATLPVGGPNGGFFRDGKAIEF